MRAETLEDVVVLEDVFVLSEPEDSGGAENRSDTDRGRRQSGQHCLARCRVFKMHGRQNM